MAGGEDDPPVGTSPGFEAQDAGVSVNDAAPAKKTVGNPLCKRAASDCNPDESYSAACAQASDGGDGGLAVTCRVSRYSSDSPVCATAGKGVDGDSCSAPSECAAGFDCVEDQQNGARRCRHYCCEAPCTVGSGNKKMYCGIGVAAGAKVPVCLPAVTCPLMAVAACPSGSTCSIVRDDGSTSCTPVGPQRAGEACDRENCGAGLTCIGNAGAQKCYKICRENAAEECPTGERCVGGPPLFKEGGFGLCVGANAGTMP